MSEPPPEPIDLSELRERLRATQEAAEKLAGRVPPQGWAASSSAEREQTAAEIQALAGILHALRDLVPDDLWDEIREVVRRLLLLLRALLDVVVDRLGEQPAQRSGGPDLQDIPIA
jgi:negative regulator of replication initiation